MLTCCLPHTRPLLRVTASIQVGNLMHQELFIAQCLPVQLAACLRQPLPVVPISAKGGVW